MATKANSKNGGVGEGEDGGDAPLLDLNEASVKKLIARAKKRGYITYDELNDALPQDQMSSEQIEDIMAALNEMGVNIVENEEASEDGDEQREREDAEDAEDDDEDPSGEEVAHRSLDDGGGCARRRDATAAVEGEGGDEDERHGDGTDDRGDG